MAIFVDLQHPPCDPTISVCCEQVSAFWNSILLADSHWIINSVYLHLINRSISFAFLMDCAVFFFCTWHVTSIPVMYYLSLRVMAFSSFFSYMADANVNRATGSLPRHLSLIMWTCLPCTISCLQHWGTVLSKAGGVVWPSQSHSPIVVATAKANANANATSLHYLYISYIHIQYVF